MPEFSSWPEWLRVSVMLVHGILFLAAFYPVRPPPSRKGWYWRAGIAGYLLVFYVIMRYEFAAF